MGLGRGPMFEKAGAWFSEKRPRRGNAVSRLGLWLIRDTSGYPRCHPGALLLPEQIPIGILDSDGYQTEADGRD